MSTYNSTLKTAHFDGQWWVNESYVLEATTQLRAAQAEITRLNKLLTDLTQQRNNAVETLKNQDNAVGALQNQIKILEAENKSLRTSNRQGCLDSCYRGMTPPENHNSMIAHVTNAYNAVYGGQGVGNSVNSWLQKQVNAQTEEIKRLKENASRNSTAQTRANEHIVTLKNALARIRGGAQTLSTCEIEAGKALHAIGSITGPIQPSAFARTYDAAAAVGLRQREEEKQALAARTYWSQFR